MTLALVPPPDRGAASSEADAALLVRRARDGDVAAIRALYIACTVVVPYISRRYRDAAFAREVFHDTVTEIWRGSAPFEARAKLSTWAIGIATRLAATAWRRLGKPTPQADGAETGDWSETETSGQELDPFHRLASRRLREGLRACLRKLSPKLGEVLLLVYYADMPHADIAAMLGLNLNTVKTRVRDGHLKLRDCMQRHWDPS